MSEEYKSDFDQVDKDASAQKVKVLFIMTILIFVSGLYVYSMFTLTNEIKRGVYQVFNADDSKDIINELR